MLLFSSPKLRFIISPKYLLVFRYLKTLRNSIFLSGIENQPNTEKMKIAMKKVSTVLKGISFSILVLCFTPIIGQEKALQAKVKEIQLSTPSTVEATKLTFEQEVKRVSSGNIEYSIIEVNGKGQAEEKIYTFALSDINENAIRSFTSRDLILVEVRANGNQKLITRSLDGGKKVDYIPDFRMYARNAENGRSLKKALEDAIPVAREVDEKGLNLNTYKEHLQWLEDHISDVSLPKEVIMQNLTVDPSKPATVSLERIRGSKKEKFVINLSQLNPTSVHHDISGSRFSIIINTKNNVRAIKYFENDIPRDFHYKVVFFASSMASSKRIQKVLKGIAPLAEDYFNRSIPQFSAISQAQQYINDHIKRVSIEEGMLTQNMILEDNLATITAKQTTSKRDLENKYIFDVSDINPLGMSYHNDGARLFLELHTKNGQPLIRHIENGELQNFRKYIRLNFESLDEALIAQKAFSFLIEKNEDKQAVKGNITDVPFYKGLEDLQTTISSVVDGEIQYEQEIELLNRDMSAFSISKVISDPKNSRKTVYEFSTRDLNRNNMRVEVSGKRVWVELGTTNAQKTVKLFKDGKVQNYQSIIQIEATDIANAKEIVEIFKKLNDLDTE